MENQAGKFPGSRRAVDRAQGGLTLIELLVILVIVGWLALMGTRCIPVGIDDTLNPKDLSNAKQIYLGLKMYAGDHEGRFPDRTADGHELKNANEAYRLLVPDYIQTEKVFYLKNSAWTPNPPDENTARGNALAAGENHYAYVPHLIDTSNPNLPLVADGFKEAEPGVYTPDEKARGGVWKGKAAAVIRVDGSGRVEKLNPNHFKVYGPTTSATPADIFAPAPGWLDATQKPLNPE